MTRRDYTDRDFGPRFSAADEHEKSKLLQVRSGKRHSLRDPGFAGAAGNYFVKNNQ